MRGAIKVKEGKDTVPLDYLHRAELIKFLLEPVALEEVIIGLEIGVWYGGMLRYLLNIMPKIKMLYGIDPWLPTQMYGRHRPIKTWDAIYEQVLSSFSKEQIVIIRGMSQDVIDQVPSGLHFVEIDGDHTYGQVMIDLKICEPKIITGGLLCGHDYYGGYSPGVKRAVDEFATMKGKEVQSKCEDVGMWWWYK